MPDAASGGSRPLDVEAVPPPASVECIRLLDRHPVGVVETISPRDHMHKTDPSAYMVVGQQALRAIRLALLCAGKDSVESFLDMASGHGRVLRFVKAEYPHARMAACDIDHEAVDFCAETFGATPVYGTVDPRELEVPETFDLIWCGSLLTHLDRPLWRGYLEFFESALPVGGLLVVTTQGRKVASKIRDPEIGNYYIQADRREAALRGYDADGFGYADYDFPEEFRESLSLPQNYGISLARPSSACSLVERSPRLELVTYHEGGWAEQDVIGCVRVD
jgi:SAM-dependent methyltransferase